MGMTAEEIAEIVEQLQSRCQDMLDDLAIMEIEVTQIAKEMYGE